MQQQQYNPTLTHHITLQGQAMRNNEQVKNRLMIVMCAFIVGYVLLALRLLDVTAADKTFAQMWEDASDKIENVSDDTMQGVRVIGGKAEWSEARFQPSIPALVLPRQSIRDRNGVLLAASVPTRSLYVRPREISNPALVAQKIATLLPSLDYATLLKRLNSPAKFVWLKRHLTPTEQETLLWAGIAGVYLHDDYNRIYPHDRLFSHVVGYADVDGKGIAGVEKYFNDDLSRTDRLKPITLSLDVRLQNILLQAVEAGMVKHSAIAAAGTIFHIPSGEARAMVSLPDFDPNRHQDFATSSKFNQMSVGKYELGSVFKPISLALALESGEVTINDSFDATNPLHYQGGVIHDFHAKKRWLNVPEILIHSSNIGTAKMVEKAGGALPQREFLQKMGMFESVGIELTEQKIPTTRPTWKPIESATISFGHGLSVTPLHLVRAMLAVHGGGVQRELTIIKDANKPATRLMSEKTSNQVNRLMRAVVQHGTASKAEVAGYAVGAKTGTADKVVNGQYHDEKKLSSMIAAFPMPNPEYFIFVMFDEPKATKDTYGYATAGWVAAPVVNKIVREITPIVGIVPKYETPPDEIDNMILQASSKTWNRKTWDSKAGGIAQRQMQPVMIPKTLRQPYVQQTSF